MARGVYRTLYSALPDDPEFQTLSPHARLVFYTVRLCAQAGVAAIFRYYPEVLRRQTGLTARQLETALIELDHERWVYREGAILWVRNGLRYEPHLSLSDEKHRKAVLKSLEGLPKQEIVIRFCDYYELPRPFEGPSKALRRASDPAPVPVSVRGEESEGRRNGHPAAIVAPIWSRGLPPDEVKERRRRREPVLEEDILATVERTQRLRTDSRLHTATWWAAATRATPFVDHCAEIRKADLWLVTKGDRRKDMAAFLRNWLTKATPEYDGDE